jgi:hypothetical protein
MGKGSNSQGGAPCRTKDDLIRCSGGRKCAGGSIWEHWPTFIKSLQILRPPPPILAAAAARDGIKGQVSGMTSATDGQKHGVWAPGEPWASASVIHSLGPS